MAANLAIVLALKSCNWTYNCGSPVLPECNLVCVCTSTQSNDDFPDHDMQRGMGMPNAYTVYTADALG